MAPLSQFQQVMLYAVELDLRHDLHTACSYLPHQNCKLVPNDSEHDLWIGCHTCKMVKTLC